MRPRSTENRDLPPGMYRRKRTRKNGKVWVGYYYRDQAGKELPLGTDLVQAKLKWADLEAKATPAELKTMKGIFDEYERKIIRARPPGPRRTTSTSSSNCAPCSIRRRSTPSRRP